MQLKLLYMHFVSIPFSDVMLTVALLLGILGSVFYFLEVVWGCCYGKLSASGVLHWEEYDVNVDGFLFFALGFT